MIITKVFLTNLYCFDNTEVDFTFPREVKNSTIPDEYLGDRPTFHFKRVCILAGANASGKTSFGKALCGIQYFIKNKRLPDFYLTTGVTDKLKPANFKIEYVTPSDNRLHFLNVTFSITDGSVSNILTLEYASIYIRKHDSNQVARKRLHEVVKNKNQETRNTRYLFVDYQEDTDEAFLAQRQFMKMPLVSDEQLGWCYALAETHHENKFRPIEIESLNLNALRKILNTFDPSIANVKELVSLDNDSVTSNYEIIFTNGDSLLLDKEGEITKQNRLSRGTYEAIKVAVFYSTMIINGDMTFYLDEQMAFSHSELEQAMLNLIVDKLGRYGQFFYTTHNYDILELNYPVHSYHFFKKTDDVSICINALDEFKKNDRSLLNYIKNDAFSILPDTSQIDDLLFED